MTKNITEKYIIKYKYRLFITSTHKTVGKNT